MNMTPERYIAIKEAEISRLHEMRAAMLKNGWRMEMRWGNTLPFIDMTKGWIAELDRRIAELTRLIVVMRRHGFSTR
jgi:hypothetical protein